MPFHNGVYYPYTNGIQGTHLSTGPPSLLNSISQYPRDGLSACSLGMASSDSFAFKFRPRKAIVDWQRIHSVDINLVMNQLDVEVLQEFIHMVTFCSLEGEQCHRCRTPVDPALLKLLQLAQLTVEWLLHCQEVLNLNLSTMEERLVVATGEHKKLLDQQSKQAENMQLLEAELKQKRREAYSLQSQLYSNAQKCHLCNKAFLTSQFLQRHMQRRHPEERTSQIRTDNEKKPQDEGLKLEISNLREKNSQLQQSLQMKMAQEKRTPSTHKDLTLELDSLGEEQIAFMERKMQEAGEVVYRDTETLCDPKSSPINRKLEQHLKRRAKMCDSRLRKLKAQHESKTNQLQQEMNRFSISKQQEQNRQLQWQMRRMQREMQKTMGAQRKQKTNASLHPPTRPMEEPIVVSAVAPEPKSKRVVPRPKSVSERTPEPGPDKTPWLNGTTATLKFNPSIRKEIQLEREQDVIRRLEILGVKRDRIGLRNKELTSVLARVCSNQDTIAKVVPEYRQCREEIACTVDEKMRGLSGQGSSDSSAASKDKAPQPTPGRDSSLWHKTKQVKQVPIKADEVSPAQNWQAVTKQLVSSGTVQPQGLVGVETAVMKTDSTDDDNDDRYDAIELQEVDLKQLLGNRD